MIRFVATYPPTLFLFNTNEQPRKADHPRRSRCKRTALKFTTEQVRIIREQRAAGVSAMEIATMYGVNVTTIHRIISERTYVKEAVTGNRDPDQGEHTGA